jgi:mutator protein MutT
VSRPVAAVIAVVPRGDEVLLVRRRNAPSAAWWGFPGGKIEPGEPLADAMLRELREETGVEAEFLRVFNAADVILPTGAAEPRHYVLVAGLCRWRVGEPVAGDDAVEARWFRYDALPREELIERVEELALEARALAALGKAPDGRR